MSHYMNVPHPDMEAEVSEEILASRNDEFVAIQSIYGDIIEEKIPGRLWVFHLDLPYISDNYLEKTIEITTVTSNLYQNRKPKAKPCTYFLRGNCKYGAKCRHLHEQRKVSVVTKSAAQEIHDESRNKYTLEMRFPQGNYSFIYRISLQFNYFSV